MKIKDRIIQLQQFDPELDLMQYHPEYASFYDVNTPDEVVLVKGNMPYSDDGLYWVEKEENMPHTGQDLIITEEKKAVVF